MKLALAVVFAAVIVAAAVYFRPPAPPPSTPETVGSSAVISPEPDPATPPAVAESTSPTALDPSPLEAFRALLFGGDYATAVAWYDDLYRRVDETTSRPYRDEILRLARSLIEKENHGAVRDLLSGYVAFFHKDVPALLLLAASQHALKDYEAAIETLYTALAEVYDPQHLGRLRQQLVLSVHERAQAIGQQQSKEAVVAFYESMLAREPDYGPYQWGLAAANLDAGRPQAALDALNLITDLSLTERARSLRQAIERRQARERIEQTAIPLQRSGLGFSVRALINGHHPVVLLIDTGASMTTIRPEVLARAGVGAATRRQRFTTANGNVDAPVVRLDSLEIAGQGVSNMEVGSLALPGLAVDGLLGMNYLSRFEFTIRQHEGLMYLKR